MDIHRAPLYRDLKDGDLMKGRPRTKAMKNFLQKEAHRIVGLSIEDDGVFIYTNSIDWCDDSGSGTFRDDSETAAIRYFYQMVRENTEGLGQ